MDVEFADSTLKQLETDVECNAGYGVEVVRGFRKVMRFIRSAKTNVIFGACVVCGLRSSREREDINIHSESTINGDSLWN